MIVPGFPGITFKEFFSPTQPLDSLPFPLSNPLRVTRYALPEVFFYYFARNGIYRGLQYFDIQPGDEVLMPELNSTIEPQVVRALGAKPIFYKIKTFRLSDFQTFRPFDDFTPDWDDVSSKLSSKTKFFHLIHYLGVPNDLDRALEFCEQNNLIFFEDAAYGFLSNYALPVTRYPSRGALGSFGHFSILCPRKTIPVPNGGILIINKQKTENRKQKNSTRNIEISKYPYPPVPPLPSSIHPLQSSYSSLWDWQHLLRSSRKSKVESRKRDDNSDFTNFQILRTFRLVKKFLKLFYVFHGSGTFNPKHINWGMTKMAYNQLFKFDYPTIIQKNLSNYEYVRNFCVNHGWDIFPREINPGTIPNAILLRIPKNVIASQAKQSPAVIPADAGIQKTTNKKQKDLNGLRVTGYGLREDGTTKNIINNFADWVSQEMLKQGIQLARPWHWNENISTLKDVPSVDAYTGRGLILPIHYQLTRTHLDYYLSLLSSLLSS